MGRTDSPTSTPVQTVVSVAVPVRSLDALTYRVPDPMRVAGPGVRVLVPLGSRQVMGVVVSAPADAAGEVLARSAVKDVLDVLDQDAFVPKGVIELARWAAEYYACGIGEVMTAALPPLATLESQWRVRLTEAGRRLAAATGDAPVRAREGMLRLLAGQQWVSQRVLASQLHRMLPGGRSRAAVRALARELAAEGALEIETSFSGRADATKLVQRACATPTGRGWLDARSESTRSDVRLGPRQIAALEIIASSAGGMRLAELARQGVASHTVRRLASRGLVALQTEQVERDPFAWIDRESPPLEEQTARSLTAEQTAALDRLGELVREPHNRPVLLHGVTGSGKTEIYLRLATVVRDRGRRALVLVPEIALTPALAAAFRGRFGDRVAVQHSGLAAGERYDQWRRIRQGLVDVVVGTRSAVFAPVERLGLIIVDEEHDASYKQEESPRYHARDLAIVRGRLEQALVVLGSATPSIETYTRAKQGRYELLTLERRVLDRPLAGVRLVNMREEAAECGPDVVISRALAESIAERLQRREQVLILLNRRGFATAVYCRQCGATLECPNCSVSLTVHDGQSSRPRARCHYCNYVRAVPPHCERCAGPYLLHMGVGTERVEQELKRLFPSASVARLDRDTAANLWAPATLLARFGRGEIDVLVGTQMIAKGHDFPRVTLVGVVSADVGLGLPDFRAAERTFQLLTQVVGRAGRGEVPGEAIIQTLFPEHYSIRHACRQDYASFAHEEQRYRLAMRYPPVVGLINAIVRGRTLSLALRAAADLASEIRQRLPLAAGFDVLGPAPAPLARLRGQSRAQLLLKGPHRQKLREAVTGALKARPSLSRLVTIDVDPVTVL